MQMSVNEIKRSYDEAKNKKRQIDILADLNCCSREEIEKIVKVESNRIAKMPVEEQFKPMKENISLDEVNSKLYARLDELDKQIKTLEDEYRKTAIAIEVIGKMKGTGEARK